MKISIAIPCYEYSGMGAEILEHSFHQMNIQTFKDFDVIISDHSIDDNVKDPAAVKTSYLKDALNALIKGSVPAMQETKSIGCTIKRLE